MTELDAIVLAAGDGRRALSTVPKQFVRVAGKPLFIHTLESLLSAKEVGRVLLTTNEKYHSTYEELINSYELTGIDLIAGGTSRQESTRLALQHATTDWVFIHEAARPYIVADQFSDLLRLRNDDSDAVVPVLQIPFTVSIGDEYMEGEVARETLRNIQLPQLFNRGVLSQCHETAEHDNYTSTEDSMMVFHYNHRVQFIEGKESNIKITTPYDLHIADLVLHKKSKLVQEYR